MDMNEFAIALEEWIYSKKFCHCRKWTWEDVICIYAEAYKRRDPSLTEEQAVDKAKALIKARTKPVIPDLDDVPGGWKMMEDMAK